MSARTEPTLSASQQIARAMLAKQALDLEINQALTLFKNNCKTNRRLLNLLFKGATKNDAEFIPIILFDMFGKVRRRGAFVPRFHPEIGCVEGHRDMSLITFTDLLQERYKSSPTYYQVRRIFRGLKKLGMVINIKTPALDPDTGRWSSRSSYQFNLAGWNKAFEATGITPPLKRGKKRGTTRHGASLDDMIKPHHREKVGSKNEAASVFFPDAPRGSASLVLCSKGGPGISSPGQVISFSVQEQSGGTLLEASPAAGQKETATPPAVGSSPVQDESPAREVPGKEVLNSPAREVSSSSETIPSFPGEGYLSASGLPEEDQGDFERMERSEYMLTQFLDMASSPNWRQDLYEDLGDLTLKQRIPDCLIVQPDATSTLCGVWPLDPSAAFLKLSPRNLQAGDLLKRCTGCPLRYKDWQQLVRLSARGSFTLDRLILLLQFARLDMCTLGFNFKIDGVTTEVDMFALIPELQAVDLGPYQGALMRFRTTGFELRLRQILPFIYMHIPACDQIDKDDPITTAEELATRTHHKALLSPDNVGKLLFDWEILWQDFTKDVLGAPVSQLLDQRVSFSDPGSYGACETIEELDHRVRLISPAASQLDMCGSVTSDLAALCHIQDFAGGVAALSRQTRQALHLTMLKLYTKAPQVWLNLESAMSPAVFAQAMPVRDIAAFRCEATARLQHQLEHDFRPVYQTLEPSKNLSF